MPGSASCSPGGQVRPCCSGSTGSFPLVCVLLASVPVYGWLACALRILHPSAPRRQASDLVCCDYLLPPPAVLTASDHRLREIDIQSFTIAQSPRASAPPPPQRGALCFAR